MHIIHINKNDVRGGAARFANLLHHGLRKLEISSTLLVDIKLSNSGDVVLLENDNNRSAWFRIFNKLAIQIGQSTFKGSWLLFKTMRFISSPVRWSYKYLGIDYYNFPGLKSKIKPLLQPGSIFQIYVAHGEYLDLRYVQELSEKHIVILRMPDAWLLSGHCAHSFDCERWKTGCGNCPDLSIPPSINRDATRYNWKFKSGLFDKSKFHIVTPSHWLMNKVKQSMLMKGAVDLSVIPNGVDTDIFSVGVQLDSRQILGIDPGATVLLFSANGIKKNRWKDYAQLQEVFKQLVEVKFEKQVEFIGLGDGGEDEMKGSIRIRYVKYQQDTNVLVHYYRSADLYIHPTKADSFPNSILEALSCGVPVIANGVGGIPEQVKSFSNEKISDSGSWAKHSKEHATGVLIPPGDSKSFFTAVKCLIENTQLRIQLGRNARNDAYLRFSQQRVTADYLKLYNQLSKREVI
ncbi:MAG: glycosyltransferase [Cyclobacteriaceae bacterium]